MGGLGTFALGVAAALVARAMGPSLAHRARPLARKGLKQAILLGEGARVRAEGLREDWDDLLAEARQDAADTHNGSTGAAV